MDLFVYFHKNSFFSFHFGVSS
ncbi:hypothetical protein XAP412_210002 [Xanthomonas phaseoli pv. phaseoli]|uniref:Uncharacterized protein n=1 Tax=Xanthomonas campestris pv. phaseoli TaxID=317013 RepID=A0AB38DYV3_XANCH|nr:hypothetical protein XAP6984_280002 [Xanthomonas phaseoli pv. phaseoli]SON81172.1 hypothetical protein XAP412_210002 [Xanthomonas phaseoli pv. phaseoli]SON85885.1 hypothetical protein XAP7430_230002 [Xanthomonas phaseoli pv. phaseoli]SOO32142.1 hypothetical protein XAP6164_810016 [Xanthomonas phaseoli pv. phaseoli]